MKHVLIVAAAIFFAIFQFSKTWTRSRERGKSLVHSYDRALDVLQKHLDGERFDIYREAVDEESSALLVLSSDTSPPKVVAKISRDRRRVTSKERRKLEMSDEFSGKSKKARRRAAKLKQYLRLETFDPSADFLSRVLEDAGVVRPQLSKPPPECEVPSL